MRRICQVTFAAVLALAGLRASAESPIWTVELAPFARLSQQTTLLSRLMGNQMIPMLLVTGAQGHFTRKYGNFRTGEPFRFAAWKGGEVTLSYPSTDYIAKMTLNHPGSEKIGTDGVHLKTEKLYAVFDGDKAAPRCTFALSEARARAALDTRFPACPPDAILRFAWAGGTVDVKADEKGFYTETTRNESAAKLPNVPVLSSFMKGAGQESGVKRVDFETLKQTIFNLARNTLGGGSSGK